VLNYKSTDLGKVNRQAVQFCERFLEFITDIEVGVAVLTHDDII